VVLAAESGGSENGGGGGGEEDGGPEQNKSKKRKNINITGMGSRYANTEDVSNESIVIAALLALASLVAVFYLIFTAPSKDSPQFNRDRDGPEYAKLGLVEEEEATLLPSAISTEV
jgi:hypothetical protein